MPQLGESAAAQDAAREMTVSSSTMCRDDRSYAHALRGCVATGCRSVPGRGIVEDLAAVSEREQSVTSRHDVRTWSEVIPSQRPDLLVPVPDLVRSPQASAEELVEQPMTPEDVAALLRIDRETVYRMARRGTLPAFKVSNKWRFLPSRLQRWMEEGETSDTSDARDLRYRRRR